MAPPPSNYPDTPSPSRRASTPPSTSSPSLSSLPQPHSSSGYAPVTAPISAFTGNPIGNNETAQSISLPHNQSDSDSASAYNPSYKLFPSLDIDFNNLSLRFYYVVLFFSLLAVSCAGTLLRKLDETPPFLKAFWRLFNLSLFLLIGFLYQWQFVDGFFRSRYFTRQTQTILWLAGLSQGLHFATWIWSLDHTSMAHSLFFVCSHPIIIVFIMLAQRIQLNRYESVGVLVGLLGSVLLLVDLSNPQYKTANVEGQAVDVEDPHNSPTLKGDLVAFLGAAFMVAYLYAGKSLRSWMPLFLYAFPITAISCIPVLVLSLMSEDVSLGGLAGTSLFGFLSSHNIGYLILIVIGPGIIGHTGINLALARVTPLAVSILLTLEPILGIIVAILAGVSTAPTVWTMMGGPLSVIGCIGAIYGTHIRQQYDAAEAAMINNWANEDGEQLSLSPEGVAMSIFDYEDEENDDALFRDSDGEESPKRGNKGKATKKKQQQSLLGKNAHSSSSTASIPAASSTYSPQRLQGPVAHPILPPPLNHPPPNPTPAPIALPVSASGGPPSARRSDAADLPGNETELEDEGDIYVADKVARLKERERQTMESQRREEEIILQAEMADELWKEKKRRENESRLEAERRQRAEKAAMEWQEQQLKEQKKTQAEREEDAIMKNVLKKGTAAFTIDESEEGTL